MPRRAGRTSPQYFDEIARQRTQHRKKDRKTVLKHVLHGVLAELQSHGWRDGQGAQPGGRASEGRDATDDVVGGEHALRVVPMNESDATANHEVHAPHGTLGNEQGRTRRVASRTNVVGNDGQVSGRE